MAFKRGRPGNPAVRGGKAVGPDYPEENFRNPFNMGIDGEYGSTGEKTLCSPVSSTLEGAGLPLHDNYNALFEEGR